MVISVYPKVGQMNYTVNETDTVTFECSATGIPPPTITWLRNGRELNDMTDFHVSVSIPIEIDFRRDNDGETVVLVTRSLDFTNVADSDSGTYICMATNDVNPCSNIVINGFELIVQGLLEIIFCIGCVTVSST